MREPMTAADEAAVTAQLQRAPRNVAGVAYRCPCGRPAVVTTQPRLADGSPFPTTYYLTCPRATSACSTLESQGVMGELAARLAVDEELAAAYQRAHLAYLADRQAMGEVPEIAGVSAGGMPDRVKCLHALVGHALAAGGGVNPLGDEALRRIGAFWRSPCLEPGTVGRPPVSPTPVASARVAAIDCGTNSIRLLIAGLDAEGGLVDVDRRLEIVRLGQGVDATGEFHPDALTRTFAAVDSYAEAVEAAGVTRDRIRFVATSAARDARNREEFFAGIRQRLGVAVDVISGNEEAELSFSGALSRLGPSAGPVLVMDIGGGSTELVVGSPDGPSTRAISQAASLDVGSVRLTERFLGAGPPAPADLERASQYIDRLLDGCGVDFTTVRAWIGVAGTVTTLAAVHLGLRHDDRDRVHGSAIPRAGVPALSDRLSGLSVEEIRALPSVHPQRADVIAAGALIAARVAARLDVAELLVSESDILDGIALDLLSSS